MTSVRVNMSFWFVLLLHAVGQMDASIVNPSDVSARTEHFDNVVQEVSDHCSGRYSPNCVRFHLLSQLDRALSSAECEVLPGVFLSHNASATTLLPMESTTLARGVDVATHTLNRLLADRVCEHVRSWKLTVPVFSNHTLQELRKTLDLYISDQEVATGRKSKFWKYMGSALLTLAFSLLSALVSKAVTLSVVALALTILGNGVGGFGFSPAAYHAAHAAAYRSPAPPRSHPVDFQYDADDGGQPYVYVNRKSWRGSRGYDDYDEADKFYRRKWN